MATAYTTCGFLTFQYQKGAIKTAGALIRPKLLAKFQYQKGAIKTAVLSTGSKYVEGFQYQKGAIKTIKILTLYIIIISNFNTKKVRLKRD